MRILTDSGAAEIVQNLSIFLGHVFGTCAVLYVLFLWNVLGAGDIKLMAVSVGVLGVDRGVRMLLCGLLLAFFVESVLANVWKCGYLGFTGIKVRLAPYLFFGFCLFALFFRR